MNTSKAVAVFGASGKTGRAFIAAATKKNVPINAFCRTITTFPKEVKVVTGSFSEQKSLDEALRGTFAVFCAIGSRPPFKDIFCESAARSILDGMKRCGISRIILLTGAMIGEDDSHLSTPMKWLKKFFLSQNPFEAKDRRDQENLVVQSGLEWTVVKPPRLSEDSVTKGVSVGENVKVGLMSSVSRNHLAGLILDEFLEPRFLKKKVWVKNK